MSYWRLAEIASRPDIEHYMRRALDQSRGGEETSSSSQTPSYREGVVQKLIQLCHHDDATLESPLTIYHSVKKYHERGEHIEEKHEKIRRQRSLSYGASPRNPVYVYDKDKVPVTFRARKLTTGDILFSCDKVKHEALLMEITRRPILPPERRPKTTGAASSPDDETLSSVSLRPMYPSDFPLPVPPKRRRPVKLVEPGERVKHILHARVEGKEMNPHCQLELKDAEDVIRAFATGSLPTVQQEVYMEFTDTVPWDPYQLKVVDKPRPSSIHFVATVFGVLLVYPDGECEHRSFAEWHRDKTIFQAMRRIRFFREYLLRKTLRIWHCNVSRVRYSRTRSLAYYSGARFHPPFLLLLQQVNSLSIDLLSLRGNNVSPTSCSTREEHGVYVRTNNKQLLKYLQRYFKYCMRTVGETVRSSHKLVEGLVAEKRHKPFVSELPISVQKRQHKQLDEDIETGYHRCNQLRGLVKLVKEIVSSSLIELVECHVRQWLTVIMSDRGSTACTPTSRDREEDEEDDGRDAGVPQCLWQIQLQINEQGTYVQYTCNCKYNIINE